MNVYLNLILKVIIMYILIMKLSLKEFKLKEDVVVISLIWGISSMLVNITELGTIIPVMLIPMFFLYKSNRNIVNSISIPIIAALICIIVDSIVVSIYIELFKVNLEILKSNSKMYLLVMLSEYILVIIISMVLSRVISKRLKVLNTKIKGKLAIVLITSVVLTFVIIYANIILLVDYGVSNVIIKLSGILFVAYFAILITMTYLLIKGITKELQYKNKQIQFENLQEYTGNLELLYTEMRAFKHDYINILSTMSNYIKNKDITGLEKHFNENIYPLSSELEIKDSKINLLKNIKIPEIKGLILSKLIKAQELNIDVEIDIMESIEEINMDIIDLSRCIGILIDNAIEAAEKSDKPYVKLAMVKKDKYTLIGIENSYIEDIPPIQNMFIKGFSTKGSGRGIGLYNLDKILKEKENGNIETFIENNRFNQLLQIISK